MYLYYDAACCTYMFDRGCSFLRLKLARLTHIQPVFNTPAVVGAVRQYAQCTDL